MAAIGTAIRLLALVMLYKISNPKILNLINAEESKTLAMRIVDQNRNNGAESEVLKMQSNAGLIETGRI